MAETPTPWIVRKFPIGMHRDTYVTTDKPDEKGRFVGSVIVGPTTNRDHEDNCRRIVAMSAACRGVSTETLESEGLDGIVAERDRLRAEREEALAALKDALDNCEMCRDLNEFGRCARCQTFAVLLAKLEKTDA